MDTPKVEWLGRVSYESALLMQEQCVQRSSSSGEERLLLLEHDPIFTIGRTSDESSLLDPARLPFPVYRTNRGGQATYHGPGQLVCYPILNLSARGRDLHRYLRFLEDVILSVLKEYGVEGNRRDGLTGVWIEDRKIASIGIGVRRWISMHGFALNVARNLSGFSSIIPCGISNVMMTSLSAEANRDLTTLEVANTTQQLFRRLLIQLPNGRF